MGLLFVLDGFIYNVVVFLVDGVIVGFVVKWNLVGDGIYYEFRWFKSWF